MEQQQLSWRQRGKLWIRLGIRLILAVTLVLLVWRVGLPILSLLAPFVAALVTAAVLHPLVRWFRQFLGWPRPLSTLVILLLIVGLLGAGIGYLGYMAGAELVALTQNWDEMGVYLQTTLNQLEDIFAQLWMRVPGQLRESTQSLVDGALISLQTAGSGLLSLLMTYTTEKAKGVPGFGLALIIYVMAAYLMTVDYPELRSQVAQHTHVRMLRFFKQVRDVALAAFGGYLKAELLLSVGVFFILLVGFLLIGQPYSLLLALGLAILDFIPILGSGTVMVPWAVIALFTQNYSRAIQLMLIWGVIALFRRVGEPKFVGDQTGLSPILSLVSIYVGMRLGGVLGMILGPTVALVILNLGKLGLFDGLRQDISAATEDIMAILQERPDRSD